jgi:hypothetical protein
MKMFIGNATRQNFVFSYRMLGSEVGGRPGANIAKLLPIPYGHQDMIPMDLETPEVDYIIAQNRKYGFCSVEDAEKSKGIFVGFMYSLDKPITSAKFSFIMGKNMDILVKRGEQLQREAAIVIDQGIQRHLQEQGLASVTQVNKTETTMTEFDRRDRDQSQPLYARGVRVLPEETDIGARPAATKSSRRRK